MYRIQRKTIGRFLPVLLLFTAFCFVYFGIPPLLPLRTEPHWPYVALVSVSPETAPDTWSSVPVLLHLSLAALQCVLMVEGALLIWIARKTITSARFLVTLGYEVALVVDIFRLWGRDWFTWILYQMRLGKLCSSASPCLPVSNSKPWVSLAALCIVLVVLGRAHYVLPPSSESQHR
jgi:hypothetical protein